MQKILVDGYNLLHRAKDLREVLIENIEAARQLLIDKLISYKARRQVAITIVFDGRQVGMPLQQQVHGLTVVYSQPPQDADTVLRALICREKNRRKTLVVSSDKSVAEFAKTMNAETMLAEEFYRRFLQSAPHITVQDKYDYSLSPEELDEWLKIFNSPK
ncbi:NYN domain-containing protein [bacterium]|nr:NYN domain-containing protein [bacterium]